MVAIGSGIRVRGAPNIDSNVVGSLDFSIVELAEPLAADAKWVQVKLSEDRTGFVDAKLLRSPVEYRINFAKMEGRWQIVFFLAGD